MVRDKTLSNLILKYSAQSQIRTVSPLAVKLCLLVLCTLLSLRLIQTMQALRAMQAMQALQAVQAMHCGCSLHNDTATMITR